MSAARPKVADYPFTTLHPNLGVVSAGPGRSFVMADIPGLIEGAADGAGLGIRFLKHLQRTRVLLHLVDIAPPDPEADPVKDARTIVGELKKFSAELAAKERWLVINKVDLLPEDEATRRAKEIVRRLRWKGTRVSGVRRDRRGHGRAQTGRHALSRGASSRLRVSRPGVRRRGGYFARARSCLVRRLLWRSALLR